MLMRLATIDIGAWVLPLVGLALVAPRTGLGNRFVHYVVASNWASAIIAWMMLPSALIRLFLPSTNEFAGLVSLLLFALSMVLTWRMTNAAIGRGAAIGTAVFAGMFVASLAVLLGLQMLLGITVPTGLRARRVFMRHALSLCFYACRCPKIAAHPRVKPEGKLLGDMH